MLSDYHNHPSSSSASGLLDPSAAHPPPATAPSYQGLLSAPDGPTSNSNRNSLLSPASSTGLSLMVNYIPSKFGSELSSRRASKISVGKSGPASPARATPSEASKRVSGLRVPKLGGGLSAFKIGEDRIGGKTLRWTRFKWCLFFTNLLLTLYSIGSMIVILLTWFNVFEGSEIIRLGNTTELSLGTTACILGLLTSLLGHAGLLTNNRLFLSIYCLLTWLTFIFIVSPGYIAYRKQQYNLEGKVNSQWSRDLGGMARMRIQNYLGCCGYFSPFVEATVSETCYSRSVLPGCKKAYMDSQRHFLGIIWRFAFAIVPAQILVMITALLCSNHVTYRFGKGMIPPAYRLNQDSMAVIMDQYAAQLADQYGPDVANRVLEKSRSNLNLPVLSKNGSGSGYGTPENGSQLKL